MRRRGEEITEEARERVGLIADTDRASSKPWPSTFFSDPRAVSILSAAASDFKSPLGARVETMTGIGYRQVCAFLSDRTKLIVEAFLKNNPAP